jgi:hypothetical protein
MVLNTRCTEGKRRGTMVASDSYCRVMSSQCPCEIARAGDATLLRKDSIDNIPARRHILGGKVVVLRVGSR